MKNRYLTMALGIVLASSMIVMTGCGKSSVADNNVGTTDAVTSDVEEPVVAEVVPATDDETAGNTEVGNDDAVAEEIVEADADVEVETETSEDDTDIADTVDETDWESAKVSGTKEDFEKYFDVEYTTNNSEVDKGNTEKITYASAMYGVDREAYVYTPANYDPNGDYPVCYVIHGIGCDGGQWVSMGADKMLDVMIANGEIEPLIAIFPSVIPPEGINPTTLSNENIDAFANFTEELVNELHPYILENYAASEERANTGVCGLSMGGMEALRLGFGLQNMFNYIGSFSAAPTLEMELLKIEDPDVVPELVLVCSGDADGTVGENPMNYHKELEKNGVDHIWYQHPGGGHAPSVWNLGFYNFMTRAFSK